MRRMIAVVLMGIVLCVIPAGAQVDEVSGKVTLFKHSCRIYDSRVIGLPLTGGVEWGVSFRNFVVAPGPSQGGSIGCGVPPEASAVLITIAVVSPSATGWLYAFPWNSPGAQPVSTMNFISGQTIANQVWVVLSDPDVFEEVGIKPSQTTHVVIDISGYLNSLED